MGFMSGTTNVHARRVSRRDLGKIALASAGALDAAQPKAAQSAAQKYASALDGLEHKVDLSAFDPVLFTQKLHDSAPLRMTFRAETRAAAGQWQTRLRAKLVELLGGFPEKPSPLQPQTLEAHDFPNYTREKFVFQSRPGVAVLGYLLTPKAAKAPHASVICVPGHGRGVDDIVGIDEQGRDRTVKVGLPVRLRHAGGRAWHGRRGHRAHGVRLPARSGDRGRKARRQTACQPAGRGRAAARADHDRLARLRRDAHHRLDRDAQGAGRRSRVGCMGISGGGTCTCSPPALEPRIRAALVSGYLNTFRDSIMSVSHCIDNYVPGILNWAEMYDVAGLIAPRPFFAESGEKDDIFPIAASRDSFAG